MCARLNALPHHGNCDGARADIVDVDYRISLACIEDPALPVIGA